MLFGEAFKLALQSLWANKLRTILTLLGVIIGVASVIMVVTLTNGAKQFVTAKINTYGASVITISKMPQTFITIEEYLEFQKRKDVTYDDYRAVVDECKSCVSVGAQRGATGKVVRGTQSTTDTKIRGWTWTMPPISNLNIAVGRSFTEIEDTALGARGHCGLRHCGQRAGRRRPAGQGDSRGRRTVHGDRRGREPGQDVRPGAWTTGWRFRSPLFLKSYGSNQSLQILCGCGRRRRA